MDVDSTNIRNSLLTHGLQIMLASLFVLAGQHTKLFDVFKELWGVT